MPMSMKLFIKAPFNCLFHKKLFENQEARFSQHFKADLAVKCWEKIFKD